MNVDRQAGAALMLCGFCLAAEIRAASLAEKGGETESPNVMLQFNDGSILHGRLVRLKAASGICIQRSDSSDPIEFTLEKVSRIQFTGRTRFAETDRPKCRVFCHLGDHFEGELISIDTLTVALDSAVMGSIRIPRQAIAQISFPGNSRELIYSGPVGMEDWVISQRTSYSESPAEGNAAWTYDGESFAPRGVGTLGRDFGLPPLSRVAFTLNWTESPRFRVIFYARDVDKYTYSEGYHFFCSGKGSIHAQPSMALPSAPVQNLTARLPVLTRGNRVRLEFRLDSQKGICELFADGIRVHEWKGLGYSGSGTGMVVYNYRPQPPFTIKDIEVHEWDGKPVRREIGNPASTLIRFGNHDKVVAEVDWLKGGKLSMKVQSRLMEIPIERVASIRFPKRTRVAVPSTTPLLVLRGQNRLSFALDGIENGRMIGASPVLGRLSLPIDSVVSLDLRTAAPKVIPATAETEPDPRKPE